MFLHPDLGVVQVDGAAKGRGFFVSSDGLLVTMSSIVDPARGATFVTADGRKLHGVIVQLDKDSGVAILRVTGAGESFLRLSDADIQPGMHVRIAGGADGPVHGTFDHWEHFGQDIAFSARASEGDIGSPLLTDDGRVIGVVHGPGEATPVWRLARMMPQLMIQQRGDPR